MSTDAKPADAKSENKTAEAEADAVAAGLKKPSALMGILKLVIPAAFAAGAAYGGTRVASAHGAPNPGAEAASAHEVIKPPGPTLPLEPFLVTIFDANKKAHPMKMTLAIEFSDGEGGHGKGDPKDFMPRIRDAFLSHLRTLSFEQATDATHIEKLRVELVERCRHVGAATAERVLVTDFVVQ